MTRTAFAMAVLVLVAASVARAGSYRAPRNALGQPDLQGVWTNISLTPLERGADFKALVVPPADAADYDNRHRGPPPPVAGDPVGGVDTEWYDGAALARIAGTPRSSWIVDPPDGRLPYSDAGRQGLAKERARNKRTEAVQARPISERCLLGTGGVAGPPMLSGRYNANYQIVQAPGSVAVVVEMNHDVRIIRLGDRTHPPQDVRQWMGDSVGWWEGGSLVVETTNFRGDESMRGMTLFMSPEAKVTERFTRASPTQILYEFTVDDPGAFTRAWSGQMALNAAPGPVYEYACHEGNYSLQAVLAGARREDREAGAQTQARTDR